MKRNASAAPTTTAATRDAPRAEAEAFASILPPGFVIGASSSAFQIEGGAHDGGREPSVWDAFAHQPGRIRGGGTGDVSADHFHRFFEDVALLADLGVDAYRFSFGWPRLQPRGSGGLSREGIAFYDRLLDGLLACGISPVATLFHWDTPAGLRGSWLNRDTAHRFSDYAYEVGGVFGDRIADWITIADPATVMLNGYAYGTHAPGLTKLFDALPAGHNQLLGHGLAVQALGAASVTGRIGMSNAYSPVEAATSADDDVAFAGLYDTVHNSMFGDAVLLGRYPAVADEFARLLRPLVEVDAADLAIIRQPLDFYAVTLAPPTRVASGVGGVADPADEASTVTALPFHFAPWPEFDRTGAGLPIAPELVETTLSALSARYGSSLPPVLLSAGASFADTLVLDELTGVAHITDTRRIDYLTSYLEAALAATSPGGPAAAVDLRGFFVWSLLDSFEWHAGFTQRYGLVHVDFTTGDRTPKESFAWLRRVLEAR